MAEPGDLELTIQRSLTRKEYHRLLSDLGAAVRAFDVLGDIAPSLLQDLLRDQSRRAHGSTANSAHAALEDLIAELRGHREELLTTRRGPFTLIRGGRELKRYFSIALVALVAGCGGGSSNEPSRLSRVEYVVTGAATATRASMTYATAGGGTAQQSDQLLPWSFSTTMTTGEFVYISAQNSGQFGCVIVEIKVRNAPYKSTQSCGAFVIATASGSVE